MTSINWTINTDGSGWLQWIEQGYPRAFYVPHYLSRIESLGKVFIINKQNGVCGIGIDEESAYKDFIIENGKPNPTR